jgi:hypothetical protein
VYQQYSAEDYDRFYRQYIRGEAEWSRQDFTKPGLPASIKSGRVRPRLKGLWKNRAGDRLRLELAFPARAVNRAGAPARAFMEWSVEQGPLKLRLEWLDKAAYRGPEALWLGFQPSLPRKAFWEVEKLARWVRMESVVKKGSAQLHVLNDRVRAGDFILRSLDAPLVAPGKGSLLNFVQRVPPAPAGVSVNLYNNIWGTNFPMWYQNDAVFRFEIS